MWAERTFVWPGPLCSLPTQPRHTRAPSGAAETRWCGWLPLTASECQGVGAIEASHERRSHPSWKLAPSALIWRRTFFRSMEWTHRAGLSSAKAIRRSQVLPLFAKLSPCHVGIEACGTSHHWARELLALGHDVRLMPPAYVKPYVKRSKTDAADAAAICEAVTRPTMRFVPIKSREQQAMLSLHCT